MLTLQFSKFAIPLALSAAISGLSPKTAMSQTHTPAEPPPAISVSSSSTVKIAPDRASIQIAVQTIQPTAAAAATENAKKQTAVFTALKALGLKDDQITTASFNVSPRYRYQENKDPVIIGYEVSNMVIVTLTDLKLVGPVLDAALKAGANNISSLSFYASNTDSAREKALGEAVAKAKREADVIANAIGGRVVDMIEISVSQDSPQPFSPVYRKNEAALMADVATPINAGDQSVIVTVYTRWKYASKSK